MPHNFLSIFRKYIKQMCVQLSLVSYSGSNIGIRITDKHLENF